MGAHRLLRRSRLEVGLVLQVPEDDAGPGVRGPVEDEEDAEVDPERREHGPPRDGQDAVQLQHPTPTHTHPDRQALSTHMEYMGGGVMLVMRALLGRLP